MFSRLGDFVTRHWLLTILVWGAIVVGLRTVAPRWEDVTKDGDLAFLPSGMPSVLGEKLLADAFLGVRAKSQIVLVVARDAESLTSEDLKLADRFASRFHSHVAVVLATQALRQSAANPDKPASKELLEEALAHLNEALRINPELAVAYHNRAILHELRGSSDEAIADRERAAELSSAVGGDPKTLLPQAVAELPLVDVWTRHNEVFGTKLRSEDKAAQLTVVQLRTEFMATQNIAVMDFISDEVRSMRREVSEAGLSGLHVGVSGSAAVGGDMLSSAAESIKNTELFTIVLVIVILMIVYRAPLLIVVPLTTIGVSLSVAMNLLALLAQLTESPGFEWWQLKVFTTTQIFIVVILFGTGTDFCLFLIARYREFLENGEHHVRAAGLALAGVADALVASALTTILGLAMMYFADFGKFKSSGPAIGLCLFVTLLACLTLAPALLRAFGSATFWPFPVRVRTGPADRRRIGGRFTAFWVALTRAIVLRPGRILVVCVLCLTPLAWIGFYSADHTTFDLLNGLSHSRLSYQGSELLKRHFPIGEGGPIVVVANKPQAGFDSEDRRQAAIALGAIFDLTKSLSTIDGVSAVRSLAEPLGDPPRRLSLASAQGRRKMLLSQHRLTKSIFLADAPEYQGNVTRFELVMEYDPFSSEAIDTLARVDRFLQRQAAESGSFWAGTSFSYAGTTAGIRDLRDVTRSDRWRIQILVVLAVLLVLLVILRQPVVCVYLILSVLFSYLVTIGATELFFTWLYGTTFQGLDWKVPIFLFVILVAVGEDYNIYLVTRVSEEQRRRGPFSGLREGLIRTGGIITSCGVIMAGTFVSMTSGTLRGIVELGFALSLGVLLDTFVVRTVLVPAFLALLLRANVKPVIACQSMAAEQSNDRRTTPTSGAC